MSPYRIPAPRSPGAPIPRMSRAPELLIVLGVLVWAAGLFGSPLWRGLLRADVFACVWAPSYFLPLLVGVFLHAEARRVS